MTGGAVVTVKQRWSVKKKAEVVLGLLRGEDIATVSRESGCQLLNLLAGESSSWESVLGPQDKAEPPFGCRPLKLVCLAAGRFPGGQPAVVQVRHRTGRCAPGLCAGGHWPKPVLRRGSSESVGQASA